MSAPNQGRVPAGVSTGGQFAAGVRGESAVDIAAPTLTVRRTVTVPAAAMRELPPLPDGVAPPDLGFQRDVDSDRLVLFVHMPAGMVEVYPGGSTWNEHYFCESGLDEDQTRGVYAWANAVHTNLASALHAVQTQVLDHEATTAVLASAAPGGAPRALRPKKRGPGAGTDLHLNAAVELRETAEAAMPPWPPTLPAPTVSFSRFNDDPAAEWQLDVEVPGYDPVTIYPEDEQASNSFDLGEYEGPEFDFEDQQALLAWGARARENVAVNMERIELQALTPGDQITLLNLASGRS
ncbi:hypothetical protein [Cellulosimicrobium sp. Marseille-Q4280]|uniref:hypothetical protein n=1 Tax=Cellulosimicrobium sp. Marseille-Q4280 TaxID=2937992 RepID=UPI00203A8AD0|nr:hypothetical protein [Cellulosimicrobium sp. Marseille-Q4280]